MLASFLLSAFLAKKIKFKNQFSDTFCMIAELDFYFPFIVLLYGAIMSLVTHLPHLKEQANQSMSPELLQWFYGHRIMGNVCLFVGAMWSLQRLFI